MWQCCWSVFSPPQTTSTQLGSDAESIDIQQSGCWGSPLLRTIKKKKEVKKKNNTHLWLQASLTFRWGFEKWHTHAALAAERSYPWHVGNNINVDPSVQTGRWGEPSCTSLQGVMSRQKVNKVVVVFYYFICYSKTDRVAEQSVITASKGTSSLRLPGFSGKGKERWSRLRFLNQVKMAWKPPPPVNHLTSFWINFRRTTMPLRSCHLPPLKLSLNTVIVANLFLRLHWLH